LGKKSGIPSILSLLAIMRKPSKSAKLRIND
jgi:hypothetical protein